MDRRDFLKTLGLGGIALTLPKPLEVVAARMSDLTAPPLHVGLARFRNLAGIGVHDFSLSFTEFPSQDRYLDLMKNWKIHLAAHENGQDYVSIIQGLSPESLAVKDCVKFSRLGEGPLSYTCFASHPLPERRLVGTMLDVWVVPQGMPKYPLPLISTHLYGVSQQYQVNNLTAPVRSVRLERTRAIELGLVSPSDPFEAL